MISNRTAERLSSTVLSLVNKLFQVLEYAEAKLPISDRNALQAKLSETIDYEDDFKNRETAKVNSG